MKIPNLHPFRRRTLVQPLAPSTVQILPSGEKAAAPANGPSADNTIKYRHGKLDIFLLGITIVIGGQYFCWNEGINAGIYSFLIGYFLIATAYITLCSCTAEITGALPFAGGSYGLARCTLGFYPAFMVGCCEALEYIAYVSASVISFVDLIVDAAPSLDAYSPLLWALFYVSSPHPDQRRSRVLGVQSRHWNHLAAYCDNLLPRIFGVRRFRGIRCRPQPEICRWI